MQAHTVTPQAAPPLFLLATEPLRALCDFITARLGSVPEQVGDGHPVLVYPGLGGGAFTTAYLRGFLRESGFDARDWDGGVNRGPDGHLENWLGLHVERVRQAHALAGRRVSLVGWSLGGVYAREVAKRCPEAVRVVITLGTPFGSLGGGNHAGAIYRLLGGDSSHLTPELEAELRCPPPVPTTSVFSKRDGVVAWQGCLDRQGAANENVEVDASHLGMGSHPGVLRVVLNRLAQPEGGWQPYRKRRRAITRAS